MGVSNTSLNAYTKIKIEGKDITQCGKIVELLKDYPDGLIREEISDKLDLRLSSVCGRINEMVKDGRVYEFGIKLNNKTDMKDKVVRL